MEFDDVELRFIETMSKRKEDNCTICLEEFKDDDKLVTTSCMHLFHEQCLEKWFTMCR